VIQRHLTDLERARQVIDALIAKAPLRGGHLDTRRRAVRGEIEFIDYLKLFDCPFCPEGKGLVLIDLPSCADARREDRDQRYLEQERLEQNMEGMIRCGPRPARWEPCRHLLQAEADVRFHFLRPRGWGGRADECGGEYCHDEGFGDDEDDDPEGDRRRWRIRFCWQCAELHSARFNHAVHLLRDHDQLRRRRPALLPATEYEWQEVYHLFEDGDDFHVYEGVEEVTARFLVARKPRLFLDQLEAKGYEYNAARSQRRRSDRSGE